MFHISLASVYDALNPLIAAVLTGLGAWIASWVVAWLKKRVKFVDAATDEKIGQVLDGGLNMAVQFGLKQASAAEAAHPTANIANPTTAAMVQYAKDHVPGAIAHFGKTDTQLAQMLMARLPQPGQ